MCKDFGEVGLFVFVVGLCIVLLVVFENVLCVDDEVFDYVVFYGVFEDWCRVFGDYVGVYVMVWIVVGIMFE